MGQYVDTFISFKQGGRGGGGWRGSDFDFVFLSQFRVEAEEHHYLCVLVCQQF